ncbi:NlpC/P60 family protein [Marivita sp. S2033]|uniref:C40 family peptidase n=1 Tax=Marivita sp. S2033 TaxID=3373187 RepID=UPI0039820E61
MTDRRNLWSNGTVAHLSLQGKVDAEQFSEGTDHRVTQAPAAALRRAPDGDRDRELLWGQTFCVLDITDGWAFGFARADGYAGYVSADMLGISDTAATHRVSVRHTVALSAPNFKTTSGEHRLLSLGTPLTVTDKTDRWATIQTETQHFYVPTPHVSPLTEHEDDPVAVAERLLGTPYVWGGNSAFGIDCSGLVQIACRACGIACPGDSDQQELVLGDTQPRGTRPQRGDVLFWEGHVGWVSDTETLLHANAHHMAVAYEPLKDALRRIETQGDGPVTRHARLTV